MRTIEISLPSDMNCRVYGQLIESNDPFDLSQDMVDVLLPNGLRISAGWYPDGDPNGQYVVLVMSGLSLFSGPCESKDVWETAETIRELAFAYCGDVVPRSFSTTDRLTPT